MDNKIIKSLLVRPQVSLKQAMQKLDKTAREILFVTDKKGAVMGAVTDGDIRRGLINGLKFSDDVEKVMHKDFTMISSDEPDKKDKAKALMQSKEIEQVPILDNKGRLVDMIIWTDIFKSDKNAAGKDRVFDNFVVVMAGGKGERLEPFTRILPKPLIPINDKPMLEIIMEKFRQNGFRNFIFTLNYKKEYIKMFLRENKFPGQVKWVEEEEYRGTAGSLSMLKNRIKDTFLVSNCDIIVDADYADILQWHKDNGNFMTLIGCHKEVEIPYGTLEMDGGTLKKFIEKPSYDILINTGVYVLEPGVIDLIPKGRYMDMDSLIKAASRKGRVSVYPIHEGWYDLGQWKEYKKSHDALRDII